MYNPDCHSIVLGQVVSAADLAAADIVLTSYDVLKRDVARQPDLEVQGKELRRKKRCGLVLFCVCLPYSLTRINCNNAIVPSSEYIWPVASDSGGCMGWLGCRGCTRATQASFSGLRLNQMHTVMMIDSPRMRVVF